MTDELLNQNQEFANTPVPEPKLFSQEEANKMAGKVRAEAQEYGRQQALKEIEARTQISGSNNGLTEDQVRNIVTEQTNAQEEQRAQYMMAEKVIKEVAARMQSGKEKFADFDEKVGQIDFTEVPQLIQLSHGVPNTAEVLYELASKPYKIASILALAEKSPRLARAEMARLSESISKNESVKSSTQNLKEPLSQLKSSTTQTSAGEPQSVADFRQNLRNRRK